jgi:hypothetical protein
MPQRLQRSANGSTVEFLQSPRSHSTPIEADADNTRAHPETPTP